jgi:phage shock protein E
MQNLFKYKMTIIGIILGSIGGYLYYFYVGCASGTCAITSKPLNSSLYGAMMGGLFFNMFESKKTTTSNEN